MSDNKPILDQMHLPGSNGRPITVLVVEDDHVHQALIENVLALGEPKFKLIFVETVDEALTAVAREPIDCVLLDHNLPDGPGTRLLEEGEEHLLETPVLSFSTSADPDVALSEFRAGCNQFILKREAFKGFGLREEILRVVEKFHKRGLRQSLSNYVRKMVE